MKPVSGKELRDNAAACMHDFIAYGRGCNHAHSCTDIIRAWQAGRQAQREECERSGHADGKDGGK